MAIGSVYRPLLEVAAEAGVDVERELAAFHLSYAQLVDPDTRLTPDQGRALARRLVHASGNRAIGLHAAVRFQLSDVDLVGYLTRHSEHSLGAARLLARYGRLLGDSADIKVEETRTQVRIVLGLSDGYWSLEGADFAAAVLYRLIKQLSGDRALAQEVQLPRARPKSSRIYREFFEAPIAFGCEFPALVYARAAMSTPFQDSDPRLLSILQTRADEMWAALQGANVWLARVRAEVSRALVHSEHDLGRIAKRCRVAERTLRRHLVAAGSSFREIVDDVRRERALALIERGERRVSMLAQQVGFSDATAFARAFRRWTGVTPQRYLERAVTGAPQTPSSIAYKPPS